MHRRLLELLVCPKCFRELSLSTSDSDPVIDGTLDCLGCSHGYLITNGIPRFVPQENYASSFGYQWNHFRKEQIDSHNGTTLSADRLWSETLWDKASMKGKWVLDAGCGAGRFLDAVAASGCEVVGIDISNAVDAAQANLEGLDNVHFVHASIYELPFRPGTFDYCYCIGVIQHTPEPEASLRSIASMVKKDGEMAVTIYPRKPWTKLFSKYWLRPITKRMSKETLLSAIEGIMPIAFPLTDVLFRVPVLGKVFVFLIPVANYVHEKQLTRQQRYAWAILDTFDMLSPFYDQPMTEPEATSALSEAGVASRRNRMDGLNLVGQKH